MKSQSSINKYAGIFNGLPAGFNEKALELFRFQYRENILYQSFADRFLASPADVGNVSQIPFLPVSFFKTSNLITGTFSAEIIFESSGTTGQSTARHHVRDVNLYRESFVKGFEYFYGNPRNYCVLGLLPAYLERQSSSLVYMVNELIRQSNDARSGFYLNNYQELHSVLKELEKSHRKTLLIGVGFALLDFAEQYPMKLSNTIIMETGGMKGRRKELTKIELHEILKKGFGLTEVHSEFGMTELLSQAYSTGNGIYKSVPWMKMLVRDEDDPLHVRESGEGLLNIIDLANRDSIGFIASDDIVKLYPDGSFEVMGRMDNSDIRGCSLLVI